MPHGNTVKDGSGDAWWELVDANGFRLVAGAAAHDAAASGNPVRMAGVYRSTLPAVATGDIVDLLLDAAGRAIIRLGAQTDFEALASAARTATTNTSDYTNIGAKGIAICVDVTSITDTPSVTPYIQWKDPSSGNYETLAQVAAALTAVTRVTYILYPTNMTAPTGDVTEVFKVPLPTTWRISMVHADADSITYSVGVSYLT